MAVAIHRRPLRRIATISVHTSPLDQPGVGDAGGMNVYVVEVAKRLAAAGIDVDVFTRATRSDLPPTVQLAPGVLVRHITAGPYEGLEKHDLPAQLCAFTSGVLRVEALHDPGHYDVIHSHYWLSGQVGWLAKERWGVPLVHSMHTLGVVKNALLADGDSPEPPARIIGERQVVDAADRLVASTAAEARELVDGYGADPGRVATVPPGVDLRRYTPGDQAAARCRLGLPADAVLLLFAGRLQPLKAPDLLLRAAAILRERLPQLSDRLLVAVIGGASGPAAAGAGSGEYPERLRELAARLGLADAVRFVPPVAPARLADWYRAASVCVVPSYNESFGLVAVEAQACGTPVVAAAVGGLTTAVNDGVSGRLVVGHDPAGYADALVRVLADGGRERRRLAAGALHHAAQFGWEVTAAGLIEVYRAVLAEQRPVASAVAGL